MSRGTGTMVEAARGGPRIDGECHITSLVVQVVPEFVEPVTASIEGLHGAQVHTADRSGKLVVCLETESLHQVTESVDRIAALDGVINATLVFHQIEESAALDELVDTDVCPPAASNSEEVSK